ncbi:MFS transporter [Thermosipho melanesiensis]|uniref:Major facilitator superfamily MFS_1 n=2 Tax=Thermosipho melanesiensis TaxID=46541 RepID=A6LJ66_THEM4|nr:MFS transporter [Thermosipho melanesiensis]ABR29967.1 major facilitator superfamily MFS_1 [Thermosipho melanesiensis BI429]APT73171.1 MFS transporter [Thermosipho melanesiensis]OOC38568.1 MFS transporter [Thermosipho melanesiensis]OOC40372.1 MFS transporter [Thermosipho melanesiensis]OOC40636.1 MFS transporter [Thermosipho melanesiensis]
MKIDQVVDIVIPKEKQRRILIFASFIWMVGAAGVMIMPFVLPDLISEWQLSKISASSLVSSTFLGMLFGALFSGVILDYFGRKSGMVFYLLISIVFTVFFGFSKSYSIAYFLRFVSGFGYGGLLPSVNTYLSEFTSIKLRGRYLVYLETSWAIGSILMALFAVTLGEKFGWRSNFYIFLLGLFILISLLKNGETPKYIFEKNGKEALEKQFGKISQEIESVEKVKVTYSAMFKKKYLKQTILVMISWFVVSFVYYALFSWAPKIFVNNLSISITKAKWYTFYVYLAQLPGYLSVAYLIEKWGRKRTLSVYFVGMGLSSFLLFATMGNISFLFVILVLSFFTLGVWGLVYAYTPELFPTSFRGTANGIAGVMARVAGILAPYFTGYFIDKSVVMVLSYTAIISIVTGVLVLILGVETKDRPID